jgi:hypothetical protein
LLTSIDNGTCRALINHDALWLGRPTMKEGKW